MKRGKWEKDLRPQPTLWQSSAIKNQYNNYERMVKKLIQPEPGDRESYISEIRASLDTPRASKAPTTSGDLAADKVKTSAQTQTSTEKIDQEKKMEITPTAQPVKCATEKFPSKTRSKDRRSPMRPSTSTDTSPNKKVLKDKQKTLSRQHPLRYSLLHQNKYCKMFDPHNRLCSLRWRLCHMLSGHSYEHCRTTTTNKLK